MNKQFTNRLLVILILTVLLLSACGGSGGVPNNPTEPPASNTLVVEQPTQALPPTPSGATISKDILLDPANATDADSLSIIAYLYEGLFKVEGSDVTPVLAESYTVSDDGLDYIITLRPNVTFHDGSPLNADAVVANFNRWFDLEDPAHSGDFAAWGDLFGGFKGKTNEGGAPKSTFDGAEKVDDLTVLIHLTIPDSQFIVKLNNPAFSIVSPTAFGADYFGTMLGQAAGTGPYSLASWSETTLALNPNAEYWGGPVATALLEFLFQ